jgi:phage terminase Nu1 subunit (DNA packaging protein)
MTSKPRPKTTRKPASTRRADGSLNRLCEALGLSKRRVSELLKQGMPDTPQAALAWRDARESDDSATALRKERIGLLKAQREAAEIANKKARGELVSRTEVETDTVRIASAMKAMLRALEVQLPQLCLGLTLSQSAPLVRQRLREIQNAFADMSAEYWKDKPTSK